MSKFEELKALVDNAEKIVFFGGAGVSTGSGIPDFRGSGGLYTEEEEAWDSPEEILSASYFITRPRDFYRYYKSKMLYPYAEPNEAHLALSELERQGKLIAVITQNIDGLHQAAGNRSVIELHGSVHRNYCLGCGKSYGLSHILESDGVPYCDVCGSIVRPHVVLYGEGLDTESFYKAAEAIRQADLLIVGGTSLTVYPAASLVEEFEGEHMVIINKDETPYDDYAELIIREPICRVMAELLD